MGAKMIPNRYLADYKSQGEEDVFRTLAEAAPSDWIVLHSLDIAPSDAGRRGEADFVVIVPSCGAAVLEVKSVAWQDADRQWHYGGSVVSPRSPFEQADTAMRSIIAYLDGSSRRPFLCSGVITPFGDIKTDVCTGKTIEWNEWQAIGRSPIRGSGLVSAIKRLIAKELESEGRHAPEFDPVAIAHALRPRFDFYVSPAARRERREEEIKRYTEEQFDVLDDCEANGHLLVEGPAGCGKTLLALELVRRAVDHGQSVLLVCYNRLLGEWLEEQAKPLGYLATATRLDAFMLTILGRRAPADQDSSFWDEDLPLSAAAQFRSRHEQFDVLVVDESQDIVSAERLLFLDECLRGGLNDGRWVFFGDFENQVVHARSGQKAARELLEEATSRRVFSHRLRRNCRNTRGVAQFAEQVAELPEQYAYSTCLRPDDGMCPTIVTPPDGVPRTDALAELLLSLLDSSFTKDEIVVLSPRGQSASTAARLAKSEKWRDVLHLAQDAPRGRIRYDSIRRFKGLEAAAIVLTDIDESAMRQEGEANLRDLLYVGSTRSVEALWIMASDATDATFRLEELAIRAPGC